MEDELAKRRIEKAFENLRKSGEYGLAAAAVVDEWICDTIPPNIQSEFFKLSNRELMRLLDEVRAYEMRSLKIVK